ncbi:MAG: HGxxPAAW family protein [Propioniciclava sp.]
MNEAGVEQGERRSALAPVTTGPDRRPVHHGRTAAAWTGSIIAAVGAAIGSVGFLMNINWLVVWVGVGVMLIGAIVGGVLRKMGYGQQG